MFPPVPVVIKNSSLVYPGIFWTLGSSSFSDKLKDTVPGRLWSRANARELEISRLGCKARSKVTLMRMYAMNDDKVPHAVNSQTVNFQQETI
jgi:hypothetical protein